MIDTLEMFMRLLRINHLSPVVQEPLTLDTELSMSRDKAFGQDSSEDTMIDTQETKHSSINNQCPEACVIVHFGQSLH
jgi:hypothetical protein